MIFFEQNALTLFVACMVLGALLVFAEKMLPKGVFGTVGAVFLLSGLALGFFTFDPTTATWITAATVFSLIVAFILWARYFPTSQVARHLVATGTSGEVDIRYRRHVGKQGTVRTPLRPSGTIVAGGGEVLDVIAADGYVDAGATVEVIEAKGNRLVVRQVTPPADS